MYTEAHTQTHSMSILMENLLVNIQKQSALLKGIFNKRPFQPRNMFIWEVQIVLNYIKSEWDSSESLADLNFQQ